MPDILRRYPKILALLAGAFSVLSLPPYLNFPVLFATLGGLLLLLDKAPSFRAAFARGYWFGFGYFAAGLAWIGNALLIDAQSFGWLYPIAFLASGAFFGLFIAVPAWLAYWFKNFYAKYLAFASLWVLSEWLRSFILTGFPWNLLGTAFAFSTETLQTASVFGTYGLSFFALLISMAPALVVRCRTRASWIVSAAMIVGLSAFIGIFGVWRLQKYPDTEQSSLTVRIVQPSIPQTLKWNKQLLLDNFMDYIDLSRQPGLENIDFVIWGETATPYALDYEEDYRRLITRAVPEKGHLITGLVRYEPSENNEYRPLNSMFILDRKGNISGFYDKVHLVPFGEYIPLRGWLPSWIRPVTNTIADFLPGRGHKVFQIDGRPSFGALICYEIIFPAEVVDISNIPEWLVNLTNDGWYGDSAGPYQHLTAARLRAVEEGITIVRAANSGISAVISKTGSILSALPLNERGILDTKLPKHLKISTIYGKSGNFIVLILLLGNIAFAAILNLLKR